MNIPNTHFSLASSQKIADICNDLLGILDINFFQYTRTYSDRSITILTNNADWLKFCVQKEILSKENIANLNSGIYLWSHILCQDIIHDAAKYFHIYQPFQFIDKREKYLDIFAFGSKYNQDHNISFYFNNLDLLQKFILFFQEKTKIFFLEADKNRIIFPSSASSKSSFSQQQISENIGRITGRKMHKYQAKLYDHLTSPLTRQQISCLYYIVQGKTAKEIAKILGLSHRTVEEHMDNLKNKLKCNAKSELITAYFKYIVQKKHPFGIN